MAKKQTLSTLEVCGMTGKSERRIQDACKSGELTAEKIGRAWRIEKASAREFARQLAKAERERIRKAEKAAKEAEKAEKRRNTKTQPKQAKNGRKTAKKGRK